MIHQILTHNANLDSRLINSNDALILIGDGVYWQPSDCLYGQIYYLEEDAKIRGVILAAPIQKMQPISLTQWVEMIDQASSVKSWF